MGVAWVEFDVTLSGDGNLILFHDETLDRTTNGTGQVANTSLADLKKLDAGAWFDRRYRGERIPTIYEAAEVLTELGLNANIEIKAARGYEAETGWAVGRYLATEWPQNLLAPIVSSFSTEALEAMADEAPGYPRGLLVGKLPRTWRSQAERLGCALIHCAHGHLRKAQALAVREAGLHLLCYTVNSARTARKLWNWGVESVFSDYPERLLDM